MGKRLGDASDPLLVSVRSGREVLDARHDGHGPEPRAQRGVDEGARGAVGRRHAVRARRLPAVHPDVRQDRDGRAGRGLRGSARQREGTQGRGRDRHRPRRVRPRAAHRRVPGHLPRAHRAGLPDRPPGADAPRDRGGLQELERQARDRLPAPEQDQRRPRHGGQRAGDGVRQPRRRLGHRRGVHPRPVDGREGPLRRLPPQRPGRGRRGGHPQHAAAGRSGRGRPDLVRRSCSRSWPRSRTTTATCATSSSRSRRAGSGSCRPASASARRSASGSWPTTCSTKA